MANRTPSTSVVVDEAKRKLDDIRGVIGYLFAAALSATCVCFAIWVIPDGPLNILIVFLGGALGWLTGILCSPDDSHQEKHFKGLGAVIVSLLSGYVAGKADAFWNSINGAALVREHDVVERVLLFFVMFVTGTIVTFIGRTYSAFWHQVGGASKSE